MSVAGMTCFSVNEITTFRWSFEEDVTAFKRHGFEGIGLWRPKVAEFGIEKAAELLAEEQLRPTSLSWAGGFTGSDGRSYRECLCDALDAIEAAATLNAGCLVVIAGGRNNHAKNHVHKLLVKALEEICEAATAVGVQLAFEPMHIGCAQEWTFITDLRKTLDLIGEVNSPNLGLNFDTYHLGHDPRVLEWLPQIVRHIRLVQVGDGRHQPLGEQTRCLLGEGRVPNTEIIRLLMDAGYQGPFELELCGEEVEHLDYSEILTSAQGFFQHAQSRECN